ncbi:unnamed protein product, partial [Polarella glacialis]
PFPTLSVIRAVAFDPPANYLAIAGQDLQGRQCLMVFDMSRALGGSVSLEAKQTSADWDIDCLRFSPFEQLHLVSCGRESIRFWRVKDGHLPGRSVVLSSLARQSHFTSLAFEFNRMGWALVDKTRVTDPSHFSSSCCRWNQGLLAPTQPEGQIGQSTAKLLALGAKIDITFRQERRIVHTEAVNAALMLAQRFGRGLEFALAMLGYHFEHLRDPNSPQLPRCNVLVQGFQLPEAAVAEVLAESKARAALGDELRELSRKLGVCLGYGPWYALMSQPCGWRRGANVARVFRENIRGLFVQSPHSRSFCGGDAFGVSDLDLNASKSYSPMVESLRTVLSGYAQSGSLNLPEGVSVLRDGSRDTGVRLNDLD